MAVDASHITFFPPPNREMIYQTNAIRYDDRQSEKHLPTYDSNNMIDSMFKADSGLASTVPISRKRSRDSSFVDPIQQQFGAFPLINDVISSQMYQQQLEIDGFIAHHIEQTRAEIAEMRRRNTRKIMELANEGIIKRLKTKEDEIIQIGQLNYSLEEKVKSLSVENQIWKQLAQSNEATANALRNNLQQVLTQVQLQQQQNFTDFTDDVQSCCGSNNQEEKGKNESGKKSNKWCRNCRKEESSVLLLPCRHLCVCSECVSSISNCPICKSTKSAGVQVNMR
ncbi:probable BOI-related E3 ubiquitin-protein ligase 3 [Rutidosis leptorrhynchoides]|uniref:probable BOI-related E3 ubiquitin-protein ligase 3 n=1 Tax=Rutidosis leptorrhynchoides TaxID=125765 RepID=UPI003A9A0DF0